MIFENRKTVPIWNGAPPMALGSSDADIPALTPYFSATGKKNGKVLLILPGGGYGMLADHEGKDYAEFFAERGYHCFVLKYRLGKNGYSHPVELSDAARAVRIIRSSAIESGINPAHIGVIGSSAGGHLAAVLGNIPEDAVYADGEDKGISSRPDWSILCYPVITFEEPLTSFWTRKYFCGTENPSQVQIDRFSCEKTVSHKTPPVFIWHNADDKIVPFENSLLFASALQKFAVPFELHIYSKGGHGCGLCDGHPWGLDVIRRMEHIQEWTSDIRKTQGDPL